MNFINFHWITCTVSMVITKSLILITNYSLSTQHQKNYKVLCKIHNLQDITTDLHQEDQHAMFCLYQDSQVLASLRYDCKSLFFISKKSSKVLLLSMTNLIWFGDDFRKSRYQNFVLEVNYIVSKEKMTLIKNGNSDFRKSGIGQ